jgi:DHA1 family tetracycline resistance protein-like MFS transporter
MIVLALCMALQMTSFAMILPLFARRFNEIGSGVEALGVSAMAYALTSALAAPFMGALADRFGRRPLVLISLTAYILAFSGYLLASSAWSFIFLRGLAGAFTAGLIPAVTGIIADLAPSNRRAQWIGIVNGGAGLGWIFGPLLGGVLYDRAGYVLPFLIAVILAAGTFVVAVCLVPETRTHSLNLQVSFQSLTTSPGPGLSWVKTWRDALPLSLATFWVLMLVSFIVMFTWAFIEPQFMFYAYGELGWTSFKLGLAMSTYGVTMALGEFLLGRWSYHWGRKPVILFGLGLFISQFIGLAIFKEFAWIALGFLMAGLGNALYDPALNAYLLDITSANHQARIMGLKSMAVSFGSILGPALVVVFTPYLKPQQFFGLAAMLVLLVILAGFVFLKQHLPGLTDARI